MKAIVLTTKQNEGHWTAYDGRLFLYVTPNQNLWLWRPFQVIICSWTNYCLNGENTTEAHTAYTIPHRLMVYFRYFGIKIRNTGAHPRPKKIHIIQINLDLQFRNTASRQVVKSLQWWFLDLPNIYVASRVLKRPPTKIYGAVSDINDKIKHSLTR